ncbi:MAG: DNA-binding response regulator [Microbacteriaceae bacterium]
MARLLVLSGAAESPIPTLALLPHNTVLAPMSPQSIANNSDVDVILLDGVTDLVAAKSMASVLATAKIPVPVLLALRDTALPVIDASWGITDFLMPTTSLAEVDARIRLAVSTHQPTTARGLSQSGVSIDESSYQANVGGRALDLTFKEFELLRFLVGNPGRVFSREQLLSEVWGYDYFGGTRTVDVHVRRLRAKLGDHESVIGTVRNVGYRFAPDGGDE